MLLVVEGKEGSRVVPQPAPLPRSTSAIDGDEDLCLLPWITGEKPQAVEIPKRIFRVVDLFAGCGGMSLAAVETARRLGCKAEIALAVDNDEDAIGVYRSNFGVDSMVARRADMARLFHGRLGSPPSKKELEIVAAAGNVDLLIAGPPCQGFSSLNNKTRGSDPRNRLYRRAVRAAEILRPQSVLIENVPTVRRGRAAVVDFAVATLAACGYTVFEKVIEASRVGIPQRRKRHILCAVREPGVDLDPFGFSKTSQVVGAASFLHEVPSRRPDEPTFLDEAPRFSKASKRRIAYLFKRNLYDLPNRSRPPCHRSDHSYNSMYGRIYPHLPAQTITSGFACMGQGRFVHPLEPRTLKAREAARLQGIPDFHLFAGVRSKDALRRMIGNAVVPRVVAIPLARIWRAALGPA